MSKLTDKEMRKKFREMDENYMTQISELDEMIAKSIKQLEDKKESLYKDRIQLTKDKRRAYHIYDHEDVSLEEAFDLAKMRREMEIEDSVPMVEEVDHVSFGSMARALSSRQLIMNHGKSVFITEDDND